MSQLNYFDRLPPLQVLLLGWVYTIAFYSNRLLTNASTPGGDAKRSLGYFEIAKESSSYLPFWDPFVAMGKPAFADPEWLFYRIIAPLFNAVPRDYYNLSYNLSLLFLLMVLMLVLYSLSRALNINQVLSGFISTLAICSGFAWSAVESGRLNTLVILITTFALIPVYRNWFTSKKALSLIALVLLVAVNLVLSGYYALVAYSFFACFVYGVHLQNLKSYSSALFYAGLHLVSLGLLGLFTSAIFILPMLESQLTNLVTSAGWGNGFSALSILSTPKMFVPFFAEQPLLSSAFPYIGFVLLPGLFGLFRATIFKQNTAFLCLSVFSLICFVLAVGMALPASYFERIYNTIPVIYLIRWGNLYGLYSMLLLILITTIGFSQLKTTSEIRRAVTISTLLVSFGLLVTELFAKSLPRPSGFQN